MIAVNGTAGIAAITLIGKAGVCPCLTVMDAARPAAAAVEVRLSALKIPAVRENMQRLLFQWTIAEISSSAYTRIFGLAANPGSAADQTTKTLTALIYGRQGRHV